MSTEYVLGQYGNVTLSASESSCMISLELWLNGGGSSGHISTYYNLNDNDLIRLIVELAKVASYIVSDPNSIQGRVIKAMKEAEV